MIFVPIIVVLLHCLLQDSLGCSNIGVTSGASEHGETIISFNPDAQSLTSGRIYHYPRAEFPPGYNKTVYNFRTGGYMGTIPEAESTYHVVGNVNERGLMVVETVFGGVSTLQSQPGAILDHISLVQVTLQRADTAQGAIQLMDTLVSTHGYASTGCSFTIADANELWVVEMIGKGNFEFGAVWVAVRIPDGGVTAHVANQARIRTVNFADIANVMHSTDVVTFAKAQGLYPVSGLDADFSFSDVYDPVTVLDATTSEIHVWYYFSSVMGSTFAHQYENYINGTNLTNRMPLWVMPPSPVSFSSVFEHVRLSSEPCAHYSGPEGTIHPSVPDSVRPIPYKYNSVTGVVTGNPIPISNGWNYVANGYRCHTHNAGTETNLRAACIVSNITEIGISLATMHNITYDMSLHHAIAAFAHWYMSADSCSQNETTCTIGYLPNCTLISSVPPTPYPTVEPTVTPTFTPSADPTVTPSVAPTAGPTASPTFTPSADPTVTPSVPPTVVPTASPTFTPSADPTVTPSVPPTAGPTATPTTEPSDQASSSHDSTGSSHDESSGSRSSSHDSTGSSHDSRRLLDMF